MEDKETLEDSMINSLAFPNMQDLVGDVAEIGLDAMLGDGLLKDIPVFGVATKIVGTAFAIRDRIFMKKVLIFLLEINTIPQHKRQEFVKSLGDDKKRRKLGETLIMLIDRLNDFYKPQIVARLFSAYIEGKISYSDFLRISLMVDRVFIEDMEVVINHYSGKEQPQSNLSFIFEELSYVGLIEIPRLTDDSPYTLTEFAKKLIEFGLDRKK